jgi:hypothetical protein
MDSLLGATGAVIRDDYGSFIPGSCCGLPHIADAASAEARALRDELILADQVGCNKLVINSDCMGVAAAIYEECSFLA